MCGIVGYIGEDPAAPILLAAMGLREDGSLQKLKDIEDIIKNKFLKKLIFYYRYFFY